MNKYFIFFCCILFNKVIAQNQIQFRNKLNEASFWYYEQKYDSACYYFSLAEKLDFKIYCLESHLYSRSLWEIGNKKKSIKILIKGGCRQFFEVDTTFYLDMTKTERDKICKKFADNEKWYRTEDQAFFDKLFQRDAQYRNELRSINVDTTNALYPSIINNMLIFDSINQQDLISYIKEKGYPGGDCLTPPIFSMLLLHSSKEFLFDNYELFLNEIRSGRMNPLDFSRAFDRLFYTENCKNCMPYNSFFGTNENSSLTPELVFINQCNIGLNPFYENIYNIPLPRNFEINRLKTPLYEYYKKNKARFNCSKF